jgi:hypothetical protein
MKNIAKDFPKITKKMGDTVKDWMANRGKILQPKTH